MTHSGRLFVVHGRVESLIHDAALIPVGPHLNYKDYWQPLVGTSPGPPRHWRERGFGGLWKTPEKRLWAVNIGVMQGADPYSTILDRVEGALRRITEYLADHEPARGHDMPLLVAVPVIGIGRGGFSRDRGAVVRRLVERLDELTGHLGLDVALVTPDPAVYAAAQYARHSLSCPVPDELEDLAKSLAARARNGQLALLLGAGVSVAAGLPSWHKLVAEIGQRFNLGVLESKSAPLSATDEAELIQKVAEGRFEHEVCKIVNRVSRPSLLHGLLAGLDCREVVTTNYDRLYESAVRATGREIESVMPWASAHDADRWVLKLHGDAERPESIVLTRRHMVRFDAANRPSGSVLQSLLLTRHLLVLGTSMTDDNVLRLAHEVQDYRTQYQSGGADTFGTVLDAGGDHARQSLWSDQLNWISLPDAGDFSGPRGAELVLDRVAMHAARNSSWLLDPRFAGLLDTDSDRRLAEDVRRLYASLPQRPGTKWWPLVQQLRSLGIAGD